ncbi:MAG: DcaP family trimeric outer membrane transporter, partial [Gammaproteobacteria bacterium]
MPFQLHATGRKIALTAVALVLTTAVKADEIDDLKSQVHDMEEQIRILMQRIEDLEQQRDRDRQAQTQATVESEPAPARTASRQAPGAFRVPGTNTDIEVRGYVKLDLIADFDQDLGDTFDFNEIADDESAAQQRGPHARLHARQSRLQVSSSTQLDKGKLLRTHLQGDFLGAAGNEVTENASGFRLRHAYLTYGSWLFGQTWSNFMENEFVAYPTTVDFFGPAGQAFVRQAQIRYSLPNGLSFAIENPETSGRHVVAFDSVTGAPVTSKVAESVGGIGVDHLPDLTAAWRGHFGPGAYEFGGLLRQLAVDNGFSNGIDDSATGWGLGGAGRWSLNEL